jgi:hypothetical protein
MKNTLFISAILLLLASACKEVQFEVPQPEGRPNLKEFPKSIIGIYVTPDEVPDTVWVYPDRYVMTDEENQKKIKKEFLLSDALLREYQQYYFLNQKDTEKDSWKLTVVAISKEGILEFHSFSFSDEDKMERIATALKARKVMKEDGKEIDYYLARPDKKQLMDVIKSGLVRDEEVKLRKISNE